MLAMFHASLRIVFASLALLSPARGADPVAPGQRAETIWRSLLSTLPLEDRPADVALALETADDRVAWVEERGERIHLARALFARRGEADVATFVLAHELGHVLQQRELTQRLDPEAAEALADLVGFELVRRSGTAPVEVASLQSLATTGNPDRRRSLDRVHAALQLTDRHERFAAMARLVPGLAMLPAASPLGRILRTWLDAPPLTAQAPGFEARGAGCAPRHRGR